MAPQVSSARPASATHIVTVGSPLHSFSEGYLVANVGDIIGFQFWAPNHSVIRGSFEDPCIPYLTMTPLDQRDTQPEIWSGFHKVSGRVDAIHPWYNVTIQVPDPIYIYCGADQSCIDFGMVMVINPVEGRNFSEYRARAKKATLLRVPGEDLPEFEGTAPPTLAPTASATITPTLPPARVTTTVLANSSSSGNSLGTGVIAGVVLGAVAALAIFVTLAFLLIARRRSRQGDLPIPPMPNEPSFGGRSPTMSPVPQTPAIFIPMTDAEKMMYLEKLGGFGDVRYRDGTVTSTATGMSRNTVADPATWQPYGSLSSPAEIPADPVGYEP